MIGVWFCLSTLGLLSGTESKVLRRLPRELVAVEQERWENCMGDLGCFNNNEPFHVTVERFFSPSPMERSKIATEFRFHPSEQYSKGFTPIFMNNTDFSSHMNENSDYDTTVDTKFIIHGFMGGNKLWPIDMTDALHRKKKCNVFIVDWSHGAGGSALEYEQVVTNARVVGAEVGLFIKNLVDATKLNPNKVHIIGHSLGAHASGYAGKWFTSKSNQKVGRITGLDPAGPYFNDVDPVVRLHMNDAEFVDVIHTNWAENRFSGFGLFEPIGHFDFYPNGGEDQPGCKTALEAEWSIASSSIFNFFSGTTESPVPLAAAPSQADQAADELACSHSRAFDLFISSIEQCEFSAKGCSSWEDFRDNQCESGDWKEVQMGYNADKYKNLIQETTHMSFFLTTTAVPPYC